MGVVYRATDSKLKREVAIKVLPEAFAADTDRLARFEREAQVLAQLQHPNIAAVYGLEESSGVRALVMELVPGEDLSERLKRGPLPLDEALSVARQIAEALEEAHEKGIVHRDLKPANVKLTPDGKVKVLDFGLAKATEPPAGSSPDLTTSPTLTGRATQAGLILGTAAYMAPEQARGKAVDRRADIWAFGAVLYEMLSGQRALKGDEVPDVLAAVLRQEIDWTALPDGTPPGVRHLLGRCLDRDVRQRLRDIGEARVALGGAGSSGAATAIPSAPGGSGRRLRIAAAGLALAAAAGGIGWWSAARNRSSLPGMPIANDLVRVTSDAGLTTDPAVSPTGSLLAYASDRGSANLNIWVQPLPAGQPVQVTRGDADAHSPAFSPDGSRIVFRSERDGGGIYVVPALGGAERLVAPKGLRPRFSPDGKRIAFLTGGRGSRSELWVVDEAGGTSRQLVPAFPRLEGATWSPDGSAIAFAGAPDASGEEDWQLVDVSTGAASPMQATAVLKAAGLPVSPPSAWASGEIVFSAPSGDSESLWSVGVSSDGRHVAGPVRRLTAGTGLDGSPAIAPGPGGRELYFASLDRRANLARVPVGAGGTAPAGDVKLLTDAAARDEWPSVSADGKTLVFLSNRRSSRAAWLKSLESGEELPLLGARGRANVSPDGRSFAYATEVEGRRALAVRPVGGGEARSFPLDVRLVWDWPVPSLLVTGGPGGDNGKLHALDLDSGKLRPLLGGATGQYYGHGRLSPDGRWMSAMEWTSAGRSRLIVFPFRDAPVPPSDWVVVSEEDSVAEENAWSPDGRLLYYVSERDGSRCLWVRPFDPRTGRPAGPSSAFLHLHGSRRSIISTASTAARLAFGKGELIFSMELQRGNVWKLSLKESD
jgi:Tol biopolymer transport system component